MILDKGAVLFSFEAYIGIRNSRLSVSFAPRLSCPEAERPPIRFSAAADAWLTLSEVPGDEVPERMAIATDPTFPNHHWVLIETTVSADKDGGTLDLVYEIRPRGATVGRVAR